MSDKLSVATALDVVGDCYSRLLDEWVRPTTKAGTLARLEAITRTLEELLLQGGRDPRAFMHPKTAEVVMKRRPRVDYPSEKNRERNVKLGVVGAQAKGPR